MDWNHFCEELNNERDSYLRRSQRNDRPASPYRNFNVPDEHHAKEHFAVNRGSLEEIMHEVYFPIIDIQEHDDLYSRLDMALK